ncbi:MAG: transcriptional repressor LexA [Planctomycetota bacterium]
MKKLSKRQDQVLNYVLKFYQEKGYSPTIREVGEHFQWKSTGTVRDVVNALDQKGFIRIHRRIHRGIEIIKYPGQGIPVMGRIAAGHPIDVLEDKRMVDMTQFITDCRDNCYILEVVGDSMVGDGILDGDYVMVESRQTARDGETVVALVEGEATLKRYYREPDGRIRLQPSNPMMQPIYTHDAVIQGIVMGVVRRYQRGIRQVSTS